MSKIKDLPSFYEKMQNWSEVLKHYKNQNKEEEKEVNIIEKNKNLSE